MKAPQVDVSYHDLSSLNELRALASKDKVGAIRQAAQQFESVFMGMLLSSMRKANQSFEEDNPLNSQTTGFYRDMYDNQLATELSKSGSLGLADLMVQQLAPEASRQKAASQVSAPNRFQREQTQALSLVYSAQSHQLPVHGQSMKLDAERIVYPVKTVAQPQAATSVAESSVVALASAQAVAQSVAKPATTSHIQQLGDEVIVGKHRQTMAPLSSVAAGAQVTDKEPLPGASAEIKPDPLASLSGPEADFVRGILPAARQAARQLGLEPLALVAQAALETGWGQRMFKAADGKQSNNLFGIKAQGGWQGDVAVVDTLEYRQGVAHQEKARFRVYTDQAQSLQDYVDFIRQQPRYQDAVAVSHNTEHYFQQLQAAGYATDPNYARKILQVLNGSLLKEVRNLLGNSEQTAQ